MPPLLSNYIPSSQNHNRGGSSSISTLAPPPLTPHTPRLPFEEYKFLENRQRLGVFYGNRASVCVSSKSSSCTHSRGNSGGSRHNPYAYMTDEERRGVSEVKHATRKALGSGFDPYEAELSFQGNGSETYRPLGEGFDEHGLGPIGTDQLLPGHYPRSNGGPRAPEFRPSREHSHIVDSSARRQAAMYSMDNNYVSDMLSHTEKYRDRYKYGTSTPPRLPAYRESRSGQPARNFGLSIEPVKSSFDWEDSEDGEDEVVIKNWPPKRNKLQRRRGRDSGYGSRGS
ncbi:hypothetical protein P154DRAFT_535816 [Amniculicola lignicola CBS 123094]|uniref:Pal1-domain-containing protein n=1 Tax=Amniculicola lignicola CBS 123094 TaxID=1392246 RepID=A0A6A5WEE3_9PLEO|nr:hypothetical protein P154DRAFT_535816 [Amniculicola lignicola CBS 123094]